METNPLLNTGNFVKRFDALSLREKMNTADKLGQYNLTRKMPCGRDMTSGEIDCLRQLAAWCNANIFFGAKPIDIIKY